MRIFVLSLLCAIAVALCTSHANAFSTRQTLALQRHTQSPTHSTPPLYSDDGGYDESMNEAAEMMAARQRPSNAPPPVPPKRLDPLMASLTRTDPSAADVPTKNVPFLGEIPVDGSLALLIPAAGIAVIGFILSIVIAINSSDEIVALLSQVSDDITNQALSQTSQQYDPNVCRGICSSQQQDLEGLKNFMDGFRK